MAEEISIFQEIDEALRVDKFEEFWRRYQIIIVAAIVMLVLATASWEYWKYHQKQVHEQQTALIEHASAIAEAGKWDDAAIALGSATHETAPLASLAMMRQAQAWIKAGAMDKAQTVYEELAADGNADQVTRDYAALEANIIADNRNQKTTATLPGNTSVFAAQAQELKALRLLQAGKMQEAEAILKPLSQDATISTAARGRALELLDSIGASK